MLQARGDQLGAVPVSKRTEQNKSVALDTYAVTIRCAVCVEMGLLGKVWQEKYLDSALQCWKTEPAPVGYGVLYALVCKLDSEKAYVGKASHKLKGADYRVFDAGGHIRGPKYKSVIHDAIVAHGWENFSYFILALVPKTMLNQAEKDAIAKYDTLTHSQGGNGYNILKGGDGGEKPTEVTERQKETMATAASIAKRSKISKAMWTDEYRLKMKGKNGWDAAGREKKMAS